MIRNQRLQYEIDEITEVLSMYQERGDTDSQAYRNLQGMLAKVMRRAGTAEANEIPVDEPERRNLNDRPKAGARAANQFGDFQVKAASDRQVWFINKLIAERDYAGHARAGWVPTSAEGISKKVASDLIEILMQCPVKPEKQAEVAAASLATEKQIAAIQREVPRRVWDNPIVALVFDQASKSEPVDRRDASEALDVLFNAPFRPRETAPAAAELESGIYTPDQGTTIYKVYWNQPKTRMLAKLLILSAGWAEMTQEQRKASDEQPSWEYQGMAYRFVKAEQKMTLEQAKAFGKIYGVCCDCGATLTDETSIANGIGPVCGAKTKGYYR